MKVQRPDCLKGVRTLSLSTLFYIPYAFPRLMTRWARRSPWLSSYEDFVKTRIFRCLRVWIRYRAQSKRCGWRK